MTGVLDGVRVVELGGVGPTPFCGMYLGDMGADVIRIDRRLGDDPLSRRRAAFRMLSRSKRSIGLDLGSARGRDVALRLAASADIVLEGFRPGVAERMRLGPEDCFGVRPSLVYGRMRGWGVNGPLADAPGHDINYLALSGALSGIGTPEQPLPPLNLVADFGGGAMSLVAGVLAALYRTAKTGKGEVVEASILGGTLSLMSMIFAIRGAGEWMSRRGANFMDGAAPFYRTYETADSAFVAVGAVEPNFYAALVSLLGLEEQIDPSRQMDRATWADTGAAFARAFRARERAAWSDAAALAACVTPVLSLDEACAHPQTAAMFTRAAGHEEPAPHPAFSSTPAPAMRAPEHVGASTRAVLAELDFSPEEIESLIDSGVAVAPSQELS